MNTDYRTLYRAFGPLALAALLFALAGCGRVQHVAPPTNDGLTIAMTTEPAAPVVGDGVVVVTVKDATGRPVDGAKIEIEGNMGHAGMTPSLGKAEGGQAGVYRVPLKWTMAGDWYVDVKVTLPDGKVVTRRFSASVQGK